VSVDNEITVKAKAQCSDTPPSLLEGSDEIQRSKRVAAAAGLLSAALFLVAVAATAGGGSLLRSHASGWLVPAAFVTGAFFFISSIVVPLGVLRESGIEAHEKENCRKDCRDLLWALEGIGDGTLKRLAWINFQQLRAYSAIAQKQARMSYYASLAAAAISLLTLASGAAVAIGLSATTAKVTVGALATAGSVLSGFLVKVFLESYQMASRQMSYYYGQPLVHCYLMHAQWLASEAREHSGDEAEFGLWQKVVEASIKASANAQDHLLSMQEPDPARRGAGSAHRCKTRQPCQAQASRQSPMPDEVESLLWANHPNGLADN
jgi:hypothetical protein